MAHLWDALCRAYDVLGFDEAAGVTSCSASSCWRGSSSPPASRTACGCWRGSGSSKFVRTASRYRTVQIRAGQQILTAADPLPHDLRDPLGRIHLCSRRVTGGSPLRTVEGSPGGTAQDRRHRPRRLRGRRPRRRPTRTSIYAVHGVGALSGQQTVAEVLGSFAAYRSYLQAAADQ
jgi:hypothetical protein